jgi:molybdopterin-guanine dinucleotide biosynthesis protein A
MGFNKALLRLGGQPLIQMVLEHVRPLTDEVLVSSNDQTTYEFLGLPIVPDIFKNQGPLAGLHAAMLLSSRSLFLLLACDMPNLHEPLLRHLALSAKGFDAVIPRTADGGDHPLCAIYRKTCFPAIERNLRKGVNKVIGIFTESPLRARWLKIEQDGFSDQDLANLNSPEDLEDFRIQRHAIEKIDD